MIVQFPSLYDDELLYSLIARYYVRSAYTAYSYAKGNLFYKESTEKDYEYCQILNTDNHTYYLRFPLDRIKKPNKELRYCPLCAKADRKKYGETYWHKAHQIGALICAVHHCYLKRISLDAKQKRTLVPAEIVIPDNDNVSYTDNQQKKEIITM